MSLRKIVFIAAVIYGFWNVRAPAGELPLNQAGSQETIGVTMLARGARWCLRDCF